MTIHAFAAKEAKAALEPFTYEPDDLGAYGAEIDITHCGVCHSDIHLVDNDWNTNKYPLVPGHEIIGVVRQVGALADANLVGQRVGVGWQRGSCLHCEDCLHGYENLCQQSVRTCVDHYGGFAQAVRVDSRFVHPIPDELDSVNAAPLLCAGITVYAPLSRLAHPKMRVGVIGIGGLGHLALQYANKMGCEVTAFTSSPQKADEAKQLGAHHVVNSRERDAIKQVRRSLDLVISTVAVNLDWAEYVKTLRSHGTLCYVGAVSEPINVKVGHLMDSERFITAGSIGGRGMMREMLDFSARHGVVAWTETLPFDSVNTAFARLRENDVRYRFVLEQ